MYIITEDYYNAWADILGEDFPIGAICNQGDDGTLHHVIQSKGMQTDGDPVLPPKKSPPIIP